MIFKCEGIIKDKTILEGVSSKTGKNYKIHKLYIDNGGIIDNLTVYQYVYDKAEKEKKYVFKAKVTDNGQIQINDIELCK